MKPEEMDPFELDLTQVLERRPAPPNLKHRVLQSRAALQAQRRRQHSLLWMRMAATLLIVALLGGAADWGVKRYEQQRKGEEARRQVLTALRITGHALNQMNAQLTAHDHDGE